MSEWSNKYVGVPFKERGRSLDGVDCWGLVWLVLRDEFAVEAPSYDYAYFSSLDSEAIEVVIKSEALKWREVPLGTEQPGDVLSFAINGKLNHVAIVVTPGLMLHCEKGKDGVLEEYARPAWNRRLRKIYRHESLMDWVHTDVPDWTYVD